MNDPILSRSDINSLYQIVDEANKAYLKESRMNDKPAFNILRVLAALRLLYHQSPPALYNAVLFITKNYNPQTYYHWKKSIEELSKNRNTLFKSKSNYCRPEMNTYTKTYQNSFNRSRINESQHLQSKSYAQIIIPQEMNTSKQESFELEDQKDVSQTNAQTGKRQFYTKADSISHVSKNHYISFEPYRHSIDYRNHYYDKENINSTNVEESRKKQSAYQYIEAIQRDLIRTAKNSQTKTPIDQSFIRNINSSESPFLFTKMPHEMHDPIQEQMRARADTFYHFNLKLKVISSLQANSFVFLKAKQNQMKSKLQYQSKILQKSFFAMQQNVKTCQQIRLKQQKSDSFFNKTLSSKVFNILKLVFELRKSSQVQKKPKLAKYNKVNYEFALNLLFSLNRANEEQNVSFIDFQTKINELIHSDEANKLFLIVKYFGKHSWATEQNIQNVIDLYKQRISRQAFNSISKQRENNMKYHAVRQKNLKKQSFFALKIRWNRFACYKQKVQTAQNKRNRTLLQKVMKSMLQTVYSTKLYSKRCEYIQRKHLYHLKAKTYKAWLTKANIQMENKVKLHSKASKLIEKIQCFIKKIVMERIKKQIEDVQKRVKMVIASNIRLRKIECFKSLRQNISNVRKTKECQVLMQRYRCAVAVARWKESTSKGKALSSMMTLIKRYYFRQLVLPSIEESIEIIRSIQFTELDIKRKCLKAIKRYMIQQKKNREHLIEAFKNKANFMKKYIAVSLLKFDYKLQKAKKEKKVINQKTQMLFSHRKSAQQQAFIANFKDMHEKKLRNTTIQTCLTNILYQSASLQLLNRLRDISLIKANGSILRQFILKGKMHLCGRQFLSVIYESKMRKVEILRREKASLSFAMTLQNIYDKQCKQRQLSINYRNVLLCSKTLQGLETLVQQYKTVKEISTKVQSKKNWDVVKDSLQYCRKIKRVTRLNKSSQIRMALGKLRNQKLLKASQANFLNWRTISLKQQLLNKIRILRKTKKQQSLLVEKTSFLHKWQGISRLQHFYISNLISKKHLYMAIKFRALKLCLNSFKVLSSSKQPRKRISSMPHHKGLAQRLSTDINE